MKTSRMHRKVSAYAKGLMGEDRACEYCQARGMVLLHRRYRSLYGEIDLVMQEGEAIVFIEVKTRCKGMRGDGLLAVTPGKQKRLIQSASLFLMERGQSACCRFDVIEITPEGIVHIQNAFDVSSQGHFD